jgi:hypothetical protein
VGNRRVEHCADLDAALLELFTADVPMLLEVSVK